MNHPELNGQRITGPGNSAIYIVMDGQRRHIPDPWTFNRLFKDWSTVEVVDIANIDEGPPISEGALLAKDPGTSPVWFVDHSQKLKHYIVSPQAMQRYNFNWSQIEPVSNYVLDAIKNGNNLS